VHGARNRERISTMIHFTYYKGAFLCATQFWYETCTGWSSQELFNRLDFCAYNMVSVFFVFVRHRVSGPRGHNGDYFSRPVPASFRRRFAINVIDTKLREP